MASVDRALERARAALAATDVSVAGPSPMDNARRALLARYVAAFERYDRDSPTADTL